MKADVTDDELRDRFRALRQADEAAAPAFDRLTRAPAPSRASSTPRLLLWGSALAAAAAAAVIIGAARYWEGRGPSAVDLQSWAALSNWQPASDELLTVSGTPWGATLTTPTDTWLNNGTSTSEQQEKEERKVL